MHAVTIVDGKLRWEEHPDPVPGDLQVLVEVRAAGLNAADLLQRRGMYPAPPGWPPDIPGLELAGEVLSVGSRVTRWAPGDLVMAVVGGGAQAELAAVDEDTLLPVPAGVDMAAAGAFPEAFFTAQDALFTQANLQLSERVLVTGAAGGVGSAAVQLAAAAGARVVASVRHAEMRPRLEALGAEVALDPEEALGAGPFDVVLELVGAASLPGALRALASGGRICVIGVGGGSRVEIDLLALMAARGRIMGSTLRSRSRSAKASVAAAVESMALPLLASGRVQVPIAGVFSMEEAQSAYERFAAGGKLGKVVLVRPA